MAGVSLLITTLTQMASAIFALRGSNLKSGIQTLLANVAPELSTHAKSISAKVLDHPLISDSVVSKTSTWLPKRCHLATALRKDELMDVLKLIAHPLDPARPNEGSAEAEALGKALSRLQAKAFAATAAGQQAVTDIELWFDRTMDRLFQKFVVQTRVWTIVFSVIVAFAVHLDSLLILNQLENNADMRASLVARSDAIQKMADKAQDREADLGTTIEDFKKKAVDLDKQMREAHLQLIPADHVWADVWPGWKLNNESFSKRHLLGILASAALLSLGAPFWFNALKGLTNLRPIVATKQKRERKREEEG